MKKSLILMIEEPRVDLSGEAVALRQRIGLLRGEGAAIGMAGATKETGGGLRVERSPPRRVRRR